MVIVVFCGCFVFIFGSFCAIFDFFWSFSVHFHRADDISLLFLHFSLTFPHFFLTFLLPANGIVDQTHYAGVFRFGYVGAMSKYLHDQLSWLIATSRGATCSPSDSPSPCNADAGEECIGGQCIVSSVYLHDAYGTGIEYVPQESRFKVVDVTKAAFTESQWRSTSTRRYDVESTGAELGILFGGFAICAAFVVVIVMGSRAIREHVKQA